MFKELFENNDHKKLFKEIEDVIIMSGFQPPRGLKNKMTLFQTSGGDEVRFKFNHSNENEEELKYKFKELAMKHFGDKKVPKVTVQKNATKPVWSFTIFLSKQK